MAFLERSWMGSMVLGLLFMAFIAGEAEAWTGAIRGRVVCDVCVDSFIGPEDHVLEGVEVKPNETLKCEPGDDKYLHLSQESLGETKKDKGTDNITVFVKFNDQKLVLGTLSLEKFPHISSDFK